MTENKARNKKRDIWIAAVLAFIILVMGVVIFLLPYNAAASIGFTKKNSDMESFWQSEDFVIGEKTYCIFTIASNNEKNRKVWGGDVVHFEVPTKNGVLKNRYSGDTVSSFYTKEQLDTLSYEDVASGSAWGAENGDMLFCSMLPNSCVKVTVDGQDATIVKNNATLNGEKISYQFYYYEYKNDDNSNSKKPQIICYDNNGTVFEIV